MKLACKNARVKARRGFTMLEVLLVVGILVALAALAAPNLIGQADTAKRKTVKIQVQQFENSFNLYKAQHDEFPETAAGFQALQQSVNGQQPIMTNIPLDPWGSAYQYQYPGSRKGNNEPDIFSMGPDRQPNTNDDIGNFTKS